MKKDKFFNQNNKFVGGEEVVKFESEFAKFTGAKYCVSLGTGTDVLYLAVKSFKFKKGSEVIVPSNTWISTAESVFGQNLKVIFCDVNLDDYSICIKDLKDKISSKTSL